MTLGTRVAVLKDGELMQVNTPQMLFDAPDNLFVATFIGSPAMNLVEAKLVKDQGPGLVFADHKVPLPAELVSSREGLEGYADKPLIVGLRPSSPEDANFAPADWPRIKGEVAVTEELGSEVNVIFHMAAPQVHHDIMIAKFDKAAKDEVEAEELAGCSGCHVRGSPRQLAPARMVDMMSAAMRRFRRPPARQGLVGAFGMA